MDINENIFLPDIKFCFNVLVLVLSITSITVFYGKPIFIMAYIRCKSLITCYCCQASFLVLMLELCVRACVCGSVGKASDYSSEGLYSLYMIEMNIQYSCVCLGGYD